MAALSFSNRLTTDALTRRRLDQCYYEAASLTITRCESEHPAGTAGWNRVVSRLGDDNALALLQTGADQLDALEREMLRFFAETLRQLTQDSLPPSDRMLAVNISAGMAVTGSLLLERLGEPKIPLGSPADRLYRLVAGSTEGLPYDVVAEVMQLSRQEIGRLIASLAKLMEVDDDDWICPLPDAQKFDLAAIPDSRAVIEEWCSFLPSVRGKRDERRNLSALLDYSERALRAHPTAVRTVFKAAEKPAKRLGLSSLLRRAATITIDACSTGDADAVGVGLKAQALICGESWWLQRHGRLVEAEVVAQDSLSLGEAIGDLRNTAYTNKCLGRLYRLMAQANTEDGRRAELFAASLERLRLAMAQFSEMPPAGAFMGEVGDCLSLMGRTYFCMGDLGEAASHALRAFECFSDTSDKDYIDASILHAEIKVARRRYKDAIKVLDPILQVAPPDDVPTSEVLARAHRVRAEALLKLKNTSEAMDDLDQAAATYARLGDSSLEDEVRWRRCLVDPNVPKELFNAVDGEPPAVAWRAVRNFSAKVPLTSKMRAHITPERQKELVAKARTDAAVETRGRGR